MPASRQRPASSMSLSQRTPTTVAPSSETMRLVTPWRSCGRWPRRWWRLA
jgi:hypothetical protein